MVSVLALNKLELKDMINEEMVENPVLDEYLDPVPTIDEIGSPRGAARARKRGHQRQKSPKPPRRSATLSRKSISAPSSTTIWTLGTAAIPSWSRSKSLRLKTFFPSPRP